jgi:hypothetical protein
VTTLLPHRAAATVLAALLVGTLAACGDDADAGPRDPIETESGSSSPSPSPSESATGAASTATVTTPTETGDPVKDAVLQAYIGYIDASTAALESTDPNLPALLVYTSGPALTSLQGFINDLAGQQQRLVGPVTISPAVVGASAGASAVVIDCMDQSQVKKLDAAGNEVPINEPDRLAVKADLQQSGSGWQVVSWDVEEGKSC